jgi:hypothetical protein
MKLEQRPAGALALLVLALGAAVPSCSSTSDEDSQTHFFSICNSDSECGGLECLCGRCTSRCGSGPCSSGTSCAEESSEAASNLCGLRPAPAMCLPECDGPADCAGGTTCLDGVCTRSLPAVADCTLETLLDYVIGNAAGVVDCGTFDTTMPPPSETATAQECALTSAASGAAFRLLWRQQGVDSIIGSALAGVVDGGGGRVYEFLYDGVYGWAPNGATALWRSCSSLAPREACTPEEALCFTCEADEVVSCECRVDPVTRAATIHCN